MDLNRLLASSQPFQLTGPGLSPTNPLDATVKFEKIAGQLLGALTIIGVLYFVAQVIFAGYAFIASQGDEKTMEATRKRLTEAVLGLTIIVVAVGIGSLVATLLGLDDILSINQVFVQMGL